MIISKTKNLTLFFLLFIILGLKAQKDSLHITRISVNDSLNLLDIYVSAPPGADVKINANTIKFLEEVPGKEIRECRLDILGFEDVIPEGFVQESVTILFLLDYSGSMKVDDRLGKSKETIKQVISQINLPPSSQFQLSAFHDDVFQSVKINKYNIDEELAKYPTPEGGGKDTDLFRAIIEKIDELAKGKGKKILVLLSDGRNDNLRNSYYELNNAKRPTAEQVYDRIKFADISNEIMVLTYGIGDGVDYDFLKALPTITDAAEDKHYFTSDPLSISQVLVDQLSEYTNDYLFHVRPSCNEYRGELRNLHVQWKGNGLGNVYANKKYKLGASIEPEYIGVLTSGRLNWFLLLIIGLVLMSLLLFLFIYLLPFAKRREFKKKHVQTYVPTANKIKRDPISQDIIREGDKVVVKGDYTILYETWEALGYSPNFNSILEFGANFEEGIEESNWVFFAQRGNTKILNWLWFGGVGGFLAWVFYSGLLRMTNLNGLKGWVTSFFDASDLDPTAAFNNVTSFAQNTSAFVEQSIQGGILGTCLIAALTVAEELGSTRKPSWLRIIIRVVLAIVLSFAVFSGGFVLQYVVMGGDVVFSGLINWSVYGLLLGIILSINSTIEWKKGILGGLISCIVAYGVYYGVLELVANDELAKLLSFILLGCILGALIVTVIARLENFELVYLSPIEYNGMVKPISKWLKNGMEVYIGRSQKCYIFVKWNDEYVEDRHAMLIYENSHVHIIALYETMVNDVIIPENQKVELNNDDIIQLGRNSLSKMQYKEH